jgi:hypothetical protein
MSHSSQPVSDGEVVGSVRAPAEMPPASTVSTSRLRGSTRALEEPPSILATQTASRTPEEEGRPLAAGACGAVDTREFELLLSDFAAACNAIRNNSTDTADRMARLQQTVAAVGTRAPAPSPE